MCEKMSITQDILLAKIEGYINKRVVCDPRYTVKNHAELRAEYVNELKALFDALLEATDE